MMTVVAIMLGLLPSCRAPDRLRNHAAEAMLIASQSCSGSDADDRRDLSIHAVAADPDLGDFSLAKWLGRDLKAQGATGYKC
jgi:hypothetical protein